MSVPIVWSVAGHDSGGGAGLSADARAAQAFGAHLCPVLAAVTAQNSQAVTHISPLGLDMLHAQLAALAQDMPPAAIKTGLLGGAAQVQAVAQWLDRLRDAGRPVALVVDPVLGASTGAAFADEATVQAYRQWLLPRATLITPNVAEAQRLSGLSGASAPALAAALRAAGAQAVAVTGGDTLQAPGWALDWIDTPQARGWLALPRLDTPHTHGTGCTFASSAAAALARGFVTADALVLAKMATAHALGCGYPAGQGAGPVAAQPGFVSQGRWLPCMSWDESADFSACAALPDHDAPPARLLPETDCALYALVDSAARARQALAAGVRLLQLRIKTPAAPDAAWHTRLRADLAQALADCRAAGATLVVNDHWRLALDLAAGDVRHLALHLGQEDVLALSPAERAALAASGARLGLSSHSLWELARARSLRPWYVACGPVWPTLTKTMPWQPQGLDNLGWWVRMAGLPVVAIGGILTPEQARDAARTGARAVCVVRGLGDDPAASAPGWQAAIAQGLALPPLPALAWPHPTLATDTTVKTP